LRWEKVLARDEGAGFGRIATGEEEERTGKYVLEISVALTKTFSADSVTSSI
jgi:hypothetical protein